jgi:hypothetical protein
MSSIFFNNKASPIGNLNEWLKLFFLPKLPCRI